jgi:hypothetical protein
MTGDTVTFIEEVIGGPVHPLGYSDGTVTAELAVVPETSHGLLAEKPDRCNRLVTDFLTTHPVPTFAPIRRRPRPPAPDGFILKTGS